MAEGALVLCTSDRDSLNGRVLPVRTLDGGALLGV
jgi:hypothetical protein